MTLNNSFFDIFDYWRRVISDPDARGLLVYAGEEGLARRGVRVVPGGAL